MWQNGESRARNGRETGGAKWRLAHADLLDRANTSMVAAGGRGIYLITDQGQEIIDGPGGMWNLQVGYGERRIAEAIGAQALTMAYNSPWHNTSGPAATLAAQIASLAPAGLNRVFFTTVRFFPRFSPAFSPFFPEFFPFFDRAAPPPQTPRSSSSLTATTSLGDRRRS